LKAIRRRRSIRSFKSQDVSPEAVEDLIEAARWAPSAGNIQPWEFVIVRKPQAKERLARAAWDQTFISEAPVVIVVCADENRSSEGYGLRGKTLYCLQDTAAAAQNIHLAAQSLGLGTCWVGAFRDEEVQEVLHIPDGNRPVAIIPIGHARQPPERRTRRPVKQMIHYESF
jgi:nitroreductase